MTETRVERIFTFLRAYNLGEKSFQNTVSFNIIDVLFLYPVKIIRFLLLLPYKILESFIKKTKQVAVKILRYSFSRFFRDFGRFLEKITTFTFERVTLAIFFSTFIIFAAISFNVTNASYEGAVFFAVFIFGLILSCIASFFISYTTAKFLKIQGPYIEEESVLREVAESFGLAGKLNKRAIVSENDVKCASIIVKGKIDSSNDLLTLSTIFSSVGVILIALSFFMNWSEPEALRKNRSFDQETIAKILSGVFFFCFFYISLLGYIRLQKLRKWSTVLDLAVVLIIKQ